MLQIVDVGGVKVSRNPEDVIVTYALGSCIAVTVYDPVTKIGGMLHYMLPDSTLDPADASRRPSMFADTGIPLMLRAVHELGALKSRLQIRVFGGAQTLGGQSMNIGKRNYLAVRKILWKIGLMINSEETGGCVSRTVRFELSTGKVWVRSLTEDASANSTGRDGVWEWRLMS